MLPLGKRLARVLKEDFRLQVRLGLDESDQKVVAEQFASVVDEDPIAGRVINQKAAVTVLAEDSGTFGPVALVLAELRQQSHRPTCRVEGRPAPAQYRDR